ncbi:MAG: ABC transporter permease subunit [Spirochaetales bacterium]|nr:ABC transporter permease subunit [Spirochaetales bacterium]
MTALIRNRRTGKIRVRKTQSSNLYMRGVLLVLAAITVYTLVTIDTKGADIAAASAKTAEYFWLMLTQPKAVPSHFGIQDGGGIGTFFSALHMLGITLALAFLTTLFGGIVALFLGVFAAGNLTNKKVSNGIKSFLAVVRAVPTVLWVLIFAIGAGLGSVAAVIGMSFHTISHLVKAYSESFEEIDEGVIEALRASGANWFQIVFQAVIPSSVSYILSWTFIRFEINFAVAVAMGAAAGAGGIGFQLFMAAGYFFDIREIGFITYLILAVSLIMEYLATRLKEKYHIHNGA